MLRVAPAREAAAPFRRPPLLPWTILPGDTDPQPGRSVSRLCSERPSLRSVYADPVPVPILSLGGHSRVDPGSGSLPDERMGKRVRRPDVSGTEGVGYHPAESQPRMNVARLWCAAGEYSRDAQPSLPGIQWLMEPSCPVSFLSARTSEQLPGSAHPTQRNCPSRRWAEYPTPLPTDY